MKRGELKHGDVFRRLDTGGGPYIAWESGKEPGYHHMANSPEAVKLGACGGGEVGPLNPWKSEAPVELLGNILNQGPTVKPILTTDKKLRKESPIARGVLGYFPRAMAAIANVSYVGNEQHNPGQPMHWAKEKSNDHADCIVRHLIEAGTVDEDGLRHTAKAAWRALALLETELEALETK